MEIHLFCKYKTIVIAFIIILLPFFDLNAQRKKDNMFSVNVGYLQSYTEIKRSPGNIIGNSKFYGKSGFYVGLDYETIVLKFFSSKTEFNYQNKGSKFDFSWNGNIEKRSKSFHYLGVTQLFRIIAIDKLNIFIGPEINYLLNDSDQNHERIEFGITSRVIYKFDRFSLSAGYFKGITPFDKMTYNSQYLHLINNNMRLGCQYILTK
jgi:hypothetical protein